MVQYNPFQGDGSASASGVVSIPAEPAAARVVFKGGRLLMPSAANGSIIAVSYEARARGVTRFFRGREAIAKCPEIVLVQVPTAREQCPSNQARTERRGGRLTRRLCPCLRRAARWQERHGHLPLLRRSSNTAFRERSRWDCQHGAASLDTLFFAKMVIIKFIYCGSAGQPV